MITKKTFVVFQAQQRRASFTKHCQHFQQLVPLYTAQDIQQMIAVSPSFKPNPDALSLGRLLDH